MLFHVVLICISWVKGYWAISHESNISFPYWLFVSSLEKCMFKSPAYFKAEIGFWLLGCWSSISIPETNLPSDIQVANAFSHSVIPFFTLWSLAFAMEKLFSSVQLSLALGVVPVTAKTSGTAPPVPCPRSFTALGLNIYPKRMEIRILKSY